MTPWLRRFAALQTAAGLLGMLLAAAPVAAQRYLEPVFSDVDITMNLAYGSLAEQKLDAYEPKGDAEVARPAVLLIHGGGFVAGSRKQALYQQMAIEFARLGYVAFSIDYRLDSQNPATLASPDTAVIDAAAALDWIRANQTRFRLDPDRIAIGGDSAGGKITVDLCYQNGAAAGAAACLNLWGGMYSRTGGKWNAPVYPDPIPASAPPTLIVHGDVDQVVPYQTSVDLAAQLLAAGVPHELLTLAGSKHYPADRSAEFIAAMVDFVYRMVVSTSSPTAVLEPDRATDTPAYAVLDANYPNPFNPETTIRFHLPRDGRVELKVYDLAGQQVAALVDGQLGAGPRTVTWDGRSDAGQALASGTYFYRLTTDDGTTARKMTLLK